MVSAFCAAQGLTVRNVSLAVLGDRLKVGVMQRGVCGTLSVKARAHGQNDQILSLSIPALVEPRRTQT